MEDFTYHRPVLVSEVIELLAPRPGALVVDGTCGGGGHAEAILQTGADVLGARSGSGRDRVMRSERLSSIWRARHPAAGEFPRCRKRCSTNSESSGSAARCSTSAFPSRQLENAERGFSIHAQRPARHADGSAPRADRGRCHQWLRRRRADAHLPRSGRRAGRASHRQSAGQAAQDRRRFARPLQLARAVEKIVWRHGRRHPATQVFQALRMEVNDELGALEEGLLALTARLESRVRALPSSPSIRWKIGS